MDSLEHAADGGFVAVKPETFRQVNSAAEFFVLAAALSLFPHSFIQFLEYERYTEHDVRVDLRHIFLDIFKAFADRDRFALIECRKYIACHRVDVVYREYREYDARLWNLEILRKLQHVVRKVLVGQHDALGKAGRS